MQIYINKNGTQTGPFDEDQVFGMLAIGELEPSDYAIKAGDDKWHKLETFFVETNNPPPLQNVPNNVPEVTRIKGDLLKPSVSKPAWYLVYLSSFGLWLLSILMLVFALFSNVLFPKSNYFLGYRPPEIMPTILVFGVLLFLQFILVHVLCAGQLNRRLWNGIGFEAVKIVKPSNYGSRRYRQRQAFKQYHTNRWEKYPEFYRNFFAQKGLRVPDVKFGSFTTYSAVNKWGFGLLDIVKPFIFLGIIAQGCDAINSLPQTESQVLQNIDMVRLSSQ
jgi:GYF domain 2